MILQINTAICGFWVIWGVTLLSVGGLDEKIDMPYWTYKILLGWMILLGVASIFVIIINVVNTLANL